MLATKTITIGGKEFEMMYCAAAENGYERMVSGTGKDINVFLPAVLERDENGTPTKIAPPTASNEDYEMLAIAAIIAASERKKINLDVVEMTNCVMYDAKGPEVIELIKVLSQLRNDWYNIPDAVKPETDEKPGDDDQKNA
jgi:hypothetical protein